MIAGGTLSVDVGGTTSVIGGALGSESGALDLVTTALVLEDLIERERSTQLGLNASFGSSSTDSGGSEFGVSGVGGSFSNSALDGTTRATIGEGNVTVRSQSDEATQTQLAATNRDLNNVTTITRESSFDTGDVFIDVGAAGRARDNRKDIRSLMETVSDLRDRVQYSAPQSLHASNEGLSIDDLISALEEKILDNQDPPRRNTVSDETLENTLQSYEALAELQLLRYLRSQGITIINPENIGVRLMPTDESDKDYIDFFGDDADFTLPRTIPVYRQGDTVVAIPVIPRANPNITSAYLGRDTIYTDRNSNLNLAIISDTYLDESGNIYRGYDVRSWVGRYNNHNGWALGRSTITEYVNGMREDRSAPNTPVETIEFEIITAINNVINSDDEEENDEEKNDED